MKTRMALMSMILVTASSLAFAQEIRVAQQDGEAACRADTRRLCRRVDPDTGTHGILMCLKENRTRLSRACRTLLESHGQ